MRLRHSRDRIKKRDKRAQYISYDRLHSNFNLSFSNENIQCCNLQKRKDKKQESNKEESKDVVLAHDPDGHRRGRADASPRNVPRHQRRGVPMARVPDGTWSMDATPTATSAFLKSYATRWSPRRKRSGWHPNMALMVTLQEALPSFRDIKTFGSDDEAGAKALLAKQDPLGKYCTCRTLIIRSQQHFC